MTARRVLVIDDKTDAVLASQRVLQLLGHEVEVAYDGKSGIEKAREFLPEVVLCDIGLPGGTDGYAVAQVLRADDRFRTTTLIAVTGYGREEDAARAHEAGFDMHLTKPVNIVGLAETNFGDCDAEP